MNLESVLGQSLQHYGSQILTTPVEQLRQALQASDWTFSGDAQTVQKLWIHGVLSAIMENHWHTEEQKSQRRGIHQRRPNVR